MRAKNLLLAGLASILLAACTEDIVTDNLSNLKVEISDGSGSTTRADYSSFPSTSFETGDAIGVYAFDGSSYVYSNVKFVKQSDGSWLPDGVTPKFKTDYTYYAYFPWRSTVYTPSTSGTVDDVDTKFSSFISDASNYFWKADQSTKADFTYSNLMIAKGTVTAAPTVKFTMAHKRGLAVFNGTGAASAEFTGNIPFLVGATRQFLMKPATSTSFTDDFGSFSLTADAGEYVNKSISGKTFVLNVTGPSAFTYTGGSNSYSIQSYKENEEEVQAPAAWTVAYDTDGDGVFNDNKPSWLTAFTESGSGSTAATNYTSTVAAQSSTVTTGVLGAALRAATPVSDVDLSMVDNAGNARASRTTANCYLVHAPGTYKIPLVYGNAIKNGSTNSSAYNPSGTSGTYFLKPFLNHNDAGITDPWLKNNSATPDGAELLWQDVNGLISAVGIDGDFLTFTVSSANIAPGNALIAAKSGSTIVWSWHIWVTEDDLSNTTVVATGSHNYTVAPVNLGWTPLSGPTQTVYAERSCDVKVTQTGAGGQNTTFTVTQTENIGASETSRAGYCTFYQGGRKDPFAPSNGVDNTVHTIYDIDGNETNCNCTTSSFGATLGNAIKNPKLGFSSRNDEAWGNKANSISNIWDATQTNKGNISTATVKTIYDPCPPGFCVPTSNLFYFIHDNKSRSMSTWDATDKGAVWDIGITGDPLWFPAAGIVNGTYSYTLANVGTHIVLNAATKPNNSYGYMEVISATSSGWWTQNFRMNIGIPVRPVVEE